MSRIQWLFVPLAVVLGFVAMVAIPFGVRQLVVEAFKIPSGSMSPTLLVGDHIFVEKYAYVTGALPERGDVVVFEYPYSGEGEERFDFVNRVVGLPGDELLFEGGLISINGKRVPTCLVGRSLLSHDVLDQEFDIYLERLGEHSHLIAVPGESHSQTEGPFVVPEGQVWMAGDNRANSFDSRFWITSAGAAPGAGVPPSFIKGRAARVWMPAERFWTPVNGEPSLPPALSALAAGLESCLPRPALP